jgi:hypothetical protein
VRVTHAPVAAELGQLRKPKEEQAGVIPEQRCLHVVDHKKFTRYSSYSPAAWTTLQKSSVGAIEPFESHVIKRRPFMGLEELWFNRAVPKSGRKRMHLLHPFFLDPASARASQSSGRGAYTVPVRAGPCVNYRHSNHTSPCPDRTSVEFTGKAQAHSLA